MDIIGLLVLMETFDDGCTSNSDEGGESYGRTNNVVSYHCEMFCYQLR